MPTAEQVNYDMMEYLEKMEQYIAKYKALPKEQAILEARRNLQETGIIDESGNLTGYYKS